MSNAVATLTREQLRAQNGVQLVKADNEGFALAKQPAGTYGFSYAPLAECPVFGKQSFQVFEVFKKADGSRWLLAYASPEHEALVNGDKEPVDVKLYPEPFETATHMVALHMDRIIKKKQPSRIDGNFIEATLGKL